MAALLPSAATAFVRLAEECGDRNDEQHRFRAELDHLAEFAPLRPVAQVMPLILSTWANLHTTYSPAATGEATGYKARAALLAGDRSITLNDPENGRQWFALAQRYSRMNGDRALISLAHAREGLARLFGLS